MAETLAGIFRRHAADRARPDGAVGVETSGRARGEPVAVDDDDTALEALLAERIAAARAAWPAIAWSPDELVRQLALRWPRDRAAIDWLSRVQVADVHLACACAAGDPIALAAFDAQLLAPLDRHVQSLGRDAAFVDEVRQRVREKLLVARAGQPPRIAEYAGLAPLDGWLRVVATRVALDLVRRRDPLALRSSHVEPVAGRAADPELDYVHARYRALFQECLGSSVRALDAEQRNLLRLHFIDGVTLEQLAALFHLGRATVVRRIAAARAQVLDVMRAQVQERLRLPRDEFESLMGQLVSQLDLSLSTVL